LLVQGGQQYSAFPYRKAFLAQACWKARLTKIFMVIVTGF